MFLSLEAERTADTFEARSSLVTGLEYSPYLLTFLSGHAEAVRSVAFSPDGHILASGSADDKTIILWDVSIESWQTCACRIANRNLTQEEWVQYFGEEPYRETCAGR